MTSVFMAAEFIEHLPWPDVESAIRTHPIALLPIGAACKEHGHHLPLNTDRLMAEQLAVRVADRCPKLLVLPTILYGHYPAFVEYPGSISISAGTFRDTIADACRCLARHGVRATYALNTGISTLSPLAEAKSLLAAEGVRFDFSDLRAATAGVRQAIERQPRGSHADEIETSIMLHVAPQVVRMRLARPELAADRPGPLTRDPSCAGTCSATGAWGDPTLASAQKGRLLVEAIVAHEVAAIERLAVESIPGATDRS
jgi:creatinine amidohydrolase